MPQADVEHAAAFDIYVSSVCYVSATYTYIHAVSVIYMHAELNAHADSDKINKAGYGRTRVQPGYAQNRRICLERVR